MGLPFETAGTITNRTAVQLGLASASDPLASTDPNFIQLASLLGDIGKKLWRKKKWTQFQQEYQFTTVANQGQYALPADYGSIIPGSNWNRTNRLPVGGALSPQEWQYLKASAVGVVFTVLFRPLLQQIWLYPETSTPAGYNIAFEYMSRWWVAPATPAWAISTAYTVNQIVTNSSKTYVCITAGTSAGSGGPTTTSTNITDGSVHWCYVPAWAQNTAYTTASKVSSGGNIYSCSTGGTSSTTGTGPLRNGVSIVDATAKWDFLVPLTNAATELPTLSSDVLWYDSLLLVDALKWAWKDGKGFDASSFLAQYKATYGDVDGDDTDGPILKLGGPSPGIPVIGAGNIPITGYGS